VTSEEEFTEFAMATSLRLRRTAFLLCGDWHTAEDLVQSALAKVFVSWHKIRQQEAAYAYAERMKRPVEIPTDALPEHPELPPNPETRIVVLDALAALPPRARAVVVLRYWEDRSVDQVADMLGCSAGNVKSQSARALGKLRAVLDGTVAGPGSPGHPREAKHQTEGI
jgi:RNA polymerase sigma-70 factor (sigma-E family)